MRNSREQSRFHYRAHDESRLKRVSAAQRTGKLPSPPLYFENNRYSVEEPRVKAESVQRRSAFPGRPGFRRGKVSGSVENHRGTHGSSTILYSAERGFCGSRGGHNPDEMAPNGVRAAHNRGIFSPPFIISSNRSALTNNHSPTPTISLRSKKLQSPPASRGVL